MEIMNTKLFFFTFIFLNMNINIFFICVLKVPLEGSVSEIVNYGPIFYVMTKKRVTFAILQI